MSGASPALTQGFEALRNGGVAALLGLFKGPITFDINKLVVFKGCTVLGINGRKMFETWYQMEELLLSGRLELDEIVTHQIPFADFAKGFGYMQSGEGIKVVMNLEA
jgi:threonine 3-dehydrogenase